MFNPSKDLSSIQRAITCNEKIQEYLKIDKKLTGIQKQLEMAKKVIKRRSWDGLASGSRRINLYFLPERSINNQAFFESVIQIDVHVPLAEDYIAYRIQSEIKKQIDGRILKHMNFKYDGMLGDTPTVDGLFCCSVRYKCYRIV